MAAMAPALTDAPNEAAHRIRFKLAQPSSALSPSAMETSQDSDNISPRGAGRGRRAEEAGRGVGKLQPLVASYLCSDVTPVPSSKLQALLPSLLPAPGPPRRSIHTPAQPPLNGQAKKQGRNLGPTLNGGSSPLPSQTTTASTEHAPFGGGAEPQTGVSSDPAPCLKRRSPPATAATPSNCPHSEPSDRPPSLTQDYSSPSTTVTGQEGVGNNLGAGGGTETPLQLVTGGPVSSQDGLGAGEVEVGPEGLVQGSVWLQERAQQSQGRQGEMSGRLRHLRRRLQVVQAKQVERHLQQQLDGLLEHTVGGGGARGRGQEDRDGIGRLLKQGSTPLELERLYVSGSAVLRGVEAGFDSDATASSSGGETDAEEAGRAEQDQRHVSLWRRAEGRYALERASIISHWSWLQAHVSDLEYRIRQHTDIYRQLRLSKGSILLGDPTLSESLAEDGEVKAEPAVVQVTQERGLDAGTGSSGSMETSLRKGCVSGRQVNGVINSLHSSSAQLEDQRGQTQLPLQEQGSTSARTRPLLSYKKRRLLRPSSLNNLHRKVQSQGVCWCVCELNPQCVTCAGRTPSSPSSGPEGLYDRPLLERLAQLDPSLHPVLSLSDDVAMGLHLQRMLKSEWNSRPLNKMKPLKKLSLKHRLSSSTSISSFSSTSSFSKNRHKTSSLLSSGRGPHSRVRSDKLHRQQLHSLQGSSLQPHYRGERSHAHSTDKPHPRKRPRPELSLDRMDSLSKLYMDSGSPYPSLPGLHTSSHAPPHTLGPHLTHAAPQAYSPLARQLASSFEAPGPFSLSCSLQQQPTRRRRGESSFDINNIVIPMSVAATTRVEKLQYKEIITPSWREVDVCSRLPAERLEEVEVEEEEEGVEVEDLSDQVFSRLHQPCEDQERTRYRWAAVSSSTATNTSTVAKRRGSRSYKSVDGRTTPLLCCTTPSTPQPSSPDSSHFQALQDYGSSPCSPASPDMAFAPYPPYPPGARDPQRLVSSDDTRCSTPDNSYEDQVLLPVLPWERRSFPLDGEPEQEPEEEAERPYRSLRRPSTCRTPSPLPSPLPPPDQASKQKPSTGHAHRHAPR